MKAFNLPADSRLILTKATPRKEHHGEDLVQAISLRLRWETSNENLALLHPNLKDMLFWRTPAVDAQAQIEGLPDITPNLRVPDVALPLKLDLEFTGYTLTIDFGIAPDTALELYVCALSKFAVDATEGGSCSIDWSLSSNKSITPELVGALCGLEGEEITATLVPPAVATGDVIDGTQAAFERDHPGAEEEQEAGDLFAAAHGGIDEDGDAADDDKPAPRSHQPRVPARYHNKATGESWSGRGLKPKWLKVALDNGARLEDFEVRQAAEIE